MSDSLADAIHYTHLDDDAAPPLLDGSRPPAVDVSTSLASLPEELLAHTAGFLLGSELSPTDVLLYGPFVGAYQDTEGPDVSWDYQLDQPRRQTQARVLPPLRNLGALRQVDQRWERAAVGLLFQRACVPTVERLEWMFQRPRLARCVQWLDVLTNALYEKAALDEDLCEPGAVLQALVRSMPSLRHLSLQGPLPAALTSSLRNPLTGQRVQVDLLESVSIVCQTSKFDDPEFINHSRPQVLHITPLLPFFALHPRLHTLHMSGCQLSPNQLGSFLDALARSGIRLRILSIEVSSRLGVGFEDVLSNRLHCLAECGRHMGASLQTVRLFGEHAEFAVNRLHTDVAEHVENLSTLSALSHINLGFTALDTSSPLLAELVAAQLMPMCPALRASQVYWEEEKNTGLEETHTSMVNLYSHRLGRRWVAAGGG